MNRTNLIAVATLAVGLFACDRSADRGAQTNTTSAAVPAENAGTTTQAPVAADTTSESAYAKDAGHVGITSTTGSDLDLNAKDAGHASISDNANAKDAGHVSFDKSLDKKKSTVAPGHIAVPSDHGRATGAPNSDGSHNLGPDGTQTR